MERGRVRMRGSVWGAALATLSLGLLASGPALAQAPSTVNAGDTAWLLTATALVLLMSLPGLALFYGGLVRAKNVLSVLMQCTAVACLASVVWLAFGYSLSFSGAAPFIGDLGKVGLRGLGRDAVSGSVPEIVFFAFQMAFAIITPALMIGAVVERVKFSGLLAFCAGWVVLVYAPVCHWIWGGGWMATLGIKDYAGGLVVHATAGVSALVLARAVGPRDGYPRDLSPPHNPGMTMTGAGLLWVGWYGFNGGSALAANADAGMALTATHMAAASAGLVWALIETLRFGRASLVGLVTGVVAGLATVTPASGFISPLSGLVLGALGSLVCFEAVALVKAKLGVDDSLDVFAVHGVGGILGTLMAILANKALGGQGYAEGVTLAGQAWRQGLGVLVVCAWSAGASLVLVAIVRRLTGLRASDEVIDDGLDLGAHGERAYHLS